MWVESPCRPAPSISRSRTLPAADRLTHRNEKRGSAGRHSPALLSLERSATAALPGPALHRLHHLGLAGESRTGLVTGDGGGVHTLHVAATHHADERVIAALGARHPGDRRTTLHI